MCFGINYPEGPSWRIRFALCTNKGTCNTGTSDTPQMSMEGGVSTRCIPLWPLFLEPKVKAPP